MELANRYMWQIRLGKWVKKRLKRLKLKKAAPRFELGNKVKYTFKTTGYGAF